MEDKQLIDEYFDANTPESRKHEIEQIIGSLPHSDSRRILFELGTGIQYQEEEEDFRSRIRAIESSTAKSRPLWFKIAASILLLISTSAILFNVLRGGQPNQKVFEKYYMPYDGVVSARSEAETSASGILAYKEGDYLVALSELAEIQNPSGQIKLVIASCYLSLEQWNEAIETLILIADTEGQMIRDNRDWYLAITYLRLDKVDKAYRLLSELKARKTPFALVATDLLSEAPFKQIEGNSDE